jgi:hypothetical protein
MIAELKAAARSKSKRSDAPVSEACIPPGTESRGTPYGLLGY